VEILFLNFLFAFAASLLLTPVSGSLGAKLGFLDYPGNRKMHQTPLPRTGGAAILLSFLTLTALSGYGLLPDPLGRVDLEGRLCYLLAGGLIAFMAGFIDDFRRLKPRFKFLFQIVAATVAYAGGLRVDSFLGIHTNYLFSIVCYLITVFWFVLFINAINLIDGLDGLAGGVTTFACTVMSILAAWGGQTANAILFAILSGATVGFLRYNFNPASIFLGDGGSYFIGYMIAGLSVMASTKSQLGATILIPLVALGVPIFDTLFSPLRRFFLGKDMFLPDKSHIHHKMLQMGLSTRRVVLIIYAVSVVLCVSTVAWVNLQNEKAGLLLLFLAVLSFIFVRKLGYFEYLATDKIFGWFKDVTDVIGISHERRSFLNLQIEISKSRDGRELWSNICRALTALDFDMAEMVLTEALSELKDPANTPSTESRNVSQVGPAHEENRSSQGGAYFTWTLNGFDRARDICKERLFKLELPLVTRERSNLGTIWLVKDLQRNDFCHYTLRRVEHLRRTVTGTLIGMQKNRAKSLIVYGGGKDIIREAQSTKSQAQRV